jgi:3-oxoacyl-[acyl-carrier protein] reductase
MIQFNFKDQVCIVSGGTRGIGAAITESFVKAGAKVHALYRSNSEAAESFKKSFPSDLQQNLELHQVDVSNYSACENFFNGLDEEIHILVNNSGIRKDNLTILLKEEDWDSVLSTNLKGTFNLSKFAVAKFIRSRYGRIINMSSIGGIIGLPGQTNYSASKAGQIAFAKSLSKEVAKRGITVNNVAPGFVATELLNDLPEKQVEEYKKQVPMRRFAEPIEVANTVLFLASKEASYITGATIEVTGGLN